VWGAGAKPKARPQSSSAIAPARVLQAEEQVRPMGDDRADRYLIGLFAGFQTLVDRPELRRPFLEIRPHLRALDGKHAAFYRVTPDGELLNVRVLHAAILQRCISRATMRMRTTLGRQYKRKTWTTGFTVPIEVRVA